MFPFQDQLSAATRNNIESHIAMMTSLTGKTFDSIEKLCKLNLAAAKASMQESNETVKQLLSTREPREFLELSIAQVQPNVEKALAYSRHVANITSDAQVEFINAAELQFNETKRNVARLIDDLAKNAPAGSRTTVDAVRSMIETTSVGYEQITRTAKHAVSVVGGTVDATVSQAVPDTTTIVVVE